MGEISVSLSSCGGGEEVSPKSKSVEENVPDAEDFEIEIYTSGGIRLYRDSYANTVGRKIPLNSGEYRLLAQYGDSAGVGFNAVWFSADRTFTVRPQTSESISAEARMNKVKVAVRFGANLLAAYHDLYASVRNAGSPGSLKFTEDETRAGYVLPGVLEMELSVLSDDGWAVIPLDLGSLSDSEDMSVYAPNTFVTFNLDINRGEGGFGETAIEVDITTDDVTKEFEIPAEAAPKDEPEVLLYGFTDGSFSFVEGVRYENVQADLKVMAGIKSCTLNVIESEYLSGKGVRGSVDLTSDGSSEISVLESLGFRWVREMAGKRLGSVDFSRLSEHVGYDRDRAFSGKFSVTVVDSLDRTVTSDVFGISQEAVNLSFAPADYNAFARRIKGLSASTSNGNPGRIEVQYRKDGGPWLSASPSPATGTSVSFLDIEGLEPGTPYQLRAVYNGNEQTATSPVTLVTETEQQVGNAGFEEWSETVVKSEIPIYFPYSPDSEDPWWDSNNRQTANKEYLTYNSYKCFPTVWYTKGYNPDNNMEEGLAARITAVSVNIFNSEILGEGNTQGELFIGTYNGTRNHPFSSRPSGMGFYYSYSPCGSDEWSAKVQIYSDSTLIGEGEMRSSSSQSGWAYCYVNINYNQNSKKATDIYIRFLQSTNSNPPTEKGEVTTPKGNYKIYGGSVLTIDNVELIYE